MNPSASTIAALLETGDTKATALSSPGGRTLSFGALRSLISRTVETLAARGIGPNDRVAIVLDNGPEMAVAFLSVASGATAAPLNPRYRAEEFEISRRSSSSWRREDPRPRSTSRRSSAFPSAN